MKIYSHSNLGHFKLSQHLQAKSKVELLKAQQEMVTGSVFDVGLSLGSKSGMTVSLKNEFERLGTLSDTNKLTQERMKAIQHSADAIKETNKEFLKGLASSSRSAQSVHTLVEAAQSVLSTATSLLNTTFNGEHIFAGVNTDVRPVNEYTEGSGAQKAVRQAFQDHFGFTIDDPRVANITGDQIRAFLEGDFAEQFNDANWAANWSQASDTIVRSRISQTETADTSISANANGFRNIIMSAVMVTELITIGLNNSAFDAVTKQAMKTTTMAVTEVASEQTKLGYAQSRTEAATTRIETQQKLINQSLLDLIAVDPAEATTRFESLKTQMQISWKTTIDILNMSVLKYLR